MPKWTGATVSVVIGAASARSTALTPGTYRVNANVPCWIKQGDVTVDATVTSCYIPTGASVLMDVSEPVTNEQYLAGIAGGAGVLYITRVVGGIEGAQ
jgi:hypothetical protein